MQVIMILAENRGEDEQKISIDYFHTCKKGIEMKRRTRRRERL